jgi:hypothetical protein
LLEHRVPALKSNRLFSSLSWLGRGLGFSLILGLRLFSFSFSSFSRGSRGLLLISFFLLLLLSRLFRLYCHGFLLSHLFDLRF